MSAKPRLDVVLLDKYTTPVLGSYTAGDRILELVFFGEDANVKSRIEDIEAAIDRKKMDPLVKDFYRIALAVYIADRWFKRSRKIPNRTIRFLLSVSDVSIWDQHKDTLRAVLYQLSGDNIIFDFVQGAKGNSFSFKQCSELDRVVSLFSGGLDSLAGVCWLRDKKLSPILVAHSSQTKVTHLQNALVAELRASLHGGLEFWQINAVPDKKKLQWPKEEESSQKLRSFLYLTLGCIFGLHKGIANLYVFENGVLAINVPASNSRIFLNTRTTHPIFLRMYQEMVSSIFGFRLEVINPFLDMTKGEIVALLNNGGLGRLIKSTISCGDIRRGVVLAGRPIATIWHCGVCVPCIVRRVGVHAAGVPDQQDVEYSREVLTGYDDLEQAHKDVVSEFLDFANKLKRDSKISTDEVLENFPAFRVEGFDPDHFIPMYLRYVDELGSFFSNCPTVRRNIAW